MEITMFKKMALGIATATLALSGAPAMAKHDRGVYDQYGRYYEPVRVDRSQVWQGRDGRYYCRRGNGTTGLVIGAAGGALLGRAIVTRGERTTGTILGAAAGALLGREVQRSMRCR
jgi:uncharacterized protein YcfJ